MPNDLSRKRVPPVGNTMSTNSQKASDDSLCCRSTAAEAQAQMCDCTTAAKQFLAVLHTCLSRTKNAFAGDIPVYDLAVQASRDHCRRDMLGHPQPAAAVALSGVHNGEHLKFAEDAEHVCCSQDVVRWDLHGDFTCAKASTMLLRSHTHKAHWYKSSPFAPQVSLYQMQTLTLIVLVLTKQHAATYVIMPAM